MTPATGAVFSMRPMIYTSYKKSIGSYFSRTVRVALQTLNHIYYSRNIVLCKDVGLFCEPLRPACYVSMKLCLGYKLHTVSS